MVLHRVGVLSGESNNLFGLDPKRINEVFFPVKEIILNFKAKVAGKLTDGGKIKFIGRFHENGLPLFKMKGEF